MNEPLRLFLVEGNEEVALLIARHLQRAGHHVSACRAAADALLVLRHSCHHLVLLDDRLPDMHGMELLQALRGDGNGTPVLMMSAQGNDRLAAQALLAGAIDYLVKDDALTYLTELPKRVHDAVSRSRLQQSNQLLVSALDSARDGICTTNVEGSIRYVNAALESMTGYTRQELMGLMPRFFRSNDQEEAIYDELWRTILAGQSWQGEIRLRRKNGTQLDSSLTFSPIADSRGQVLHAVGIYRDITDRKQLERQLLHAQKMQSIGTLAGGVAHEFNNLLAGIQGYATLGLREPDMAPQPKAFFQSIVDLSDRAANLTRQLLAFARKPALSRRPTDMASLMASTAELVRKSLSIDVVLEIAECADDGQPLLAPADANQIQQVLINLALNARDALHRPEPILFRLERLFLTGELPAFPENVPAGEYIMLEVRDRGHGMTPEVVEHVFDPFFTTKEIGKGSGLGLPVAFGIIHGHQGRLTLESQPGQGTCVRLYLPRLAAAPTVAQAPVAEPAATTMTASRAILVVDDEQAVLDVMRRFLEIVGHRVTCVASGAEAFDVLSQNNAVDLVILDLMIPFEDGAATFKQLRRQRPNLPILLCTGMLQTDSATPSFQGEQVHLLRKPFRMEELWRMVEQAIAPQGAA